MLKVGFGRVDITPPVGCHVQGHFIRIVCSGIHDPLYANALLVEDGKERACLVVCDLLGVSRSLAADAAARVEQLAGIPRDRVIVAATHTHTGPTVLDRNDLTDECQPTPEYLAALPARIATASVQAVRALAPAGVCCGHGREDGVSFGRRYLRRDGSVVSIPHPGDPDLVKPLAPTDPDLGVIAFGQSYRALRGAALNFTLHLDTIDGPLISSDFPGVIRDTLEREFGPMGFVYTSGAMGNINHVNAMRPMPKREYYETAHRTGLILAAEARRTLARMEEFRDDASVRLARRQVRLPLKPCSDADARAAEAHLRAHGRQDRTGFLRAIAALRARERDEGDGALRSQIAALAVGDIVLAAVPGEYFVEFGLEIKRASPFAHTFIVELASDYVGYIPTRAAYDEGGYESLGTPLAPGAGELLTGELLDLIQSLT